jgi:hypothetical protein
VLLENSAPTPKLVLFDLPARETQLQNSQRIASNIDPPVSGVATTLATTATAVIAAFARLLIAVRTTTMAKSHAERYRRYSERHEPSERARSGALTFFDLRAAHGPPPLRRRRPLAVSMLESVSIRVESHHPLV